MKASFNIAWLWMVFLPCSASMKGFFILLFGYTRICFLMSLIAGWLRMYNTLIVKRTHTHAVARWCMNSSCTASGWSSGSVLMDMNESDVLTS